jgi:hypothetical protein
VLVHRDEPALHTRRAHGAARPSGSAPRRERDPPDDGVADQLSQHKPGQGSGERHPQHPRQQQRRRAPLAHPSQCTFLSWRDLGLPACAHGPCRGSRHPVRRRGTQDVTQRRDGHWPGQLTAAVHDVRERDLRAQGQDGRGREAPSEQGGVLGQHIRIVAARIALSRAGEAPRFRKGAPVRG